VRWRCRRIPEVLLGISLLIDAIFTFLCNVGLIIRGLFSTFRFQLRREESNIAKINNSLPRFSISVTIWERLYKRYFLLYFGCEWLLRIIISSLRLWTRRLFYLPWERPSSNFRLLPTELLLSNLVCSILCCFVLVCLHFDATESDWQRLQKIDLTFII
jgi:hypothetical protein